MNLQDLNTNLGDVFLQLKEGKMTPETANSLVNVSNSIINNAKVQLQGIKQFHELGYEPSASESGTVKKIVGDVFDRKFQFAQSIGHNNISDAHAKIGKEKFEELFNQSIYKK
ncbi:hypothetical protein [Chryseobacterium caseinilyticum]|uniref:Uncharacterized protein n=1 Tax=Chryseobacterium caseinilyticum TaxID=2771428 RepID=A0ABR8Z722_9FLAO|nr:hypothetical protein [Chryseobacterium caseinilyticum]MBD8081098.1 hypothetical protein [Chryseobacterium caseinilyticum]